MRNRIKRWWCRIFHDEVSAPFYGQYECFQCGQVFKCHWERKEAA